MRTLLIAIDSEAGGGVAARHVAGEHKGATVHLLAVEPPVRSYVGQFLSLAAIRDHQRAAAAQKLSEARRTLDDAGIGYTVHVLVGDEAPQAAELARRVGADEIVMGDGAGGWLDRLLFRVLAARVIRCARVPVLIVKGPQRTTTGAPGRWGYAFSR